MNNLTKLATVSVAATLATTATFAGGLERATFSSSILFEEGTYADLSIAQTNPEVSPSSDGSFDPFETFETIQFGFKTDLNDKISVAFKYNSNPAGANIDYTGASTIMDGVAALEPMGTNALTAEVDADSMQLLGKYQINENISVYGGLNRFSGEASANLTATGSGNFNFSKDTGTGYILGAAYEIPDIALRAALSYESKIDLSHDMLLADMGNADTTADASSGSAEAYTLEFQSGIAQDTLLFGSWRHSKASDVNIILDTAGALGTPTELTTFGDTDGYTLGVARRFTDKFAGSVSVYYEAPTNDEFASYFSPYDGITSVNIGGRYSMDNGAVISGGISYSMRGDAIASATDLSTADDSAWTDNKVITVGIRVGKTF